VTPAWLAPLRAQARQPPRAPRLPLWVGAAQIGSVEADFMDRIGLQPKEYGREQLLKMERDGVAGWCFEGDATSTLNRLACTMRDAGLAGAWRNEQLAVTNEHGCRVATIERAAVRPLGIATQAVHLLAQSPDGRHWVQQRALDKSNDPGLWDTLVGGMVSAEKTRKTALQRETWEEAGLRIDELHGLTHGGHLIVEHPAHDGAGTGYVIERIDWYSCIVPAPVQPANQDSEVAQFALLDSTQLEAALQRGDFTADAALLLAARLGLD
jgi:8-oxo-dGTP pyrophosphatase MutT (NUDIX family)